MTHVKTSPYYPQSNGKIERWHRGIKSDALRRYEPSDPEQAEKIIGDYVSHYNGVRLHSAIGYITPADKLAGREAEIWAESDTKLEQARERRRTRRCLASLTSSASERVSQSLTPTYTESRFG